MKNKNKIKGRGEEGNVRRGIEEEKKWPEKKRNEKIGKELGG